MRVLVAMSGGVDSAVAALLIQKMGHTPVGVTMRLTGEEDMRDETKGESDARAVAEKLGIGFHVEDLREDFAKYVTDKFVCTYMNGRTPNPCVDCNRHIKFGKLMEIADKYGCEKLATGHYARVVEDEKGVFHLLKAADLTKDQSYMLHCLTQAKLSRVLLPLGELTKAQTRALACEHGFVSANSKDSQDICFVPDGDYAGYIENRLGYSVPDGDFVKENGEVVGRHRGHIRYTPGQRKGLGLSLPAPLYVKEKDTADNRVILCDGEGLMKSSITVSGFNFIPPEPLKEKTEVCVKVRYRQIEVPAFVTPIDDAAVRIDFVSPVRAPAPGQAAVLYSGDEVLGGGTIV